MNANNNTHLPQAAINTRTAWRPVLRPVSCLVIAAHLALALQPLSVLAQDKGQAPFNPQAQAQLQRLGQWSQKIEQAKAQKAREAQSPADKVSDRLARVDELTRGLGANANARLALSQGRRAERLTELRSLLQDVNADVATVRAEFAATKAELIARKLPAEIIARHDEAVAQFEQRTTQFGQIAAKLTSNRAVAPTGTGLGATQSIASANTAADAEDPQAIQELKQFFDRHPTQRRPSQRDPKKLPWSTPQPASRAPSETKSAWQQQIAAPEQARAAPVAAASSIGPLQFTTPPAPSQAPTPADLAETDEIQLTPAIRAKAAELGNNPVAIYNWVRNNIDYAPTAGAIQSAQDTLDKRRGNATDTASLLIALLRAANIPARYQFGTVDIDAQKVQNWVGGATKPEAALQILNQGGIAARGIGTSRITTIRMEHAWVTVYANWTPSRGNRNATDTQHPNPNAALNAWVPLDASFKQYTYTPGMDLKTQVPLDATALLNAARQGATVNEAEGWVQNLNQAAIQSQLADYQNRLKAYIDSTPTGTSSTVGDVIGKKLIAQQVPSLLAGTLPHAVVQQGAEMSAVPESLQHKFTYKLYASQNDQANDSPLLTFTEKTSKLVGKRLTLSYVPATQQDADTIASYLPRPHADGSPIQPSELPTSLPGYLIKLRAQISLDGQVVAQANQALPMGTDLYSSGGFTQLYDTSQWDLTSEETNVVGQATAIGISAGGVSAAQIDQLRVRIAAAQGVIQSGNTAAIAMLNSEQVAGDLLSTMIWGWFAASESHNRISQSQARVVEFPGLSYGLLQTIASATSSWGVVRKVSFLGVNTDIGHARNLAASRDGVQEDTVTYNRMRGQYMSALEHAIPELMFSNPGQCNLVEALQPDSGLGFCPQGVSATKAIASAAKSGQKIFTITSAVYQMNSDIVATRLASHSESTKFRIQQALDAGYEVTVHEQPITLNGWSGTGFLIIDPFSGAGGYLIEGGGNGGLLYVLTFLAVFLALLAPFLVLFFAGPGFGVLLTAGFSALNLAGIFAALSKGFFEQEELSPEQRSARLGMLLLLSVASSIFGARGGSQTEAIPKAEGWLFSGFTLFPSFLAKLFNET